MKVIHDPIEFVSQIELFTVAIIGSFITLKFLNALYENIYEPAIDIAINSDKPDKYYLKIGRYYIQASTVVKELLKWIIMIVLLMLVYNFVVNRRKH